MGPEPSVSAFCAANPEAYIAVTLRKILDNHMQRDIAELMPWNFSE
jgi:transposase